MEFFARFTARRSFSGCCLLAIWFTYKWGKMRHRKKGEFGTSEYILYICHRNFNFQTLQCLKITIEMYNKILAIFAANLRINFFKFPIVQTYEILIFSLIRHFRWFSKTVLWTVGGLENDDGHFWKLNSRWISGEEKDKTDTQKTHQMQHLDCFLILSYLQKKSLLNIKKAWTF